MYSSDFHVRHNPLSICSILSFAGVSGKQNGSCKDVYFVNAIGCNSAYLSDILKMDQLLLERQSNGIGHYLRVDAFPALSKETDIAMFKNAYTGWERGHNVDFLSIVKKNTALSHTLSSAFIKTEAQFSDVFHDATDSMKTNFMIKMFFWADRVLAPLLSEGDNGSSDKFVFTGTIKKHEYLFCYLITLLGIDVLILSPRVKASLPITLLSLSSTVQLGPCQDVSIPPFSTDVILLCPHITPSAPAQPPPVAVGIFSGGQSANSEGKISLQREGTHSQRSPVCVSADTPVHPILHSVAQRELTFEELALLSSSIVMIEVYNGDNDPVCSGSGIMVGTGGYILTNHHVIEEGNTYVVSIEDDKKLYSTQEVIKTNFSLDLALIRIQCKLVPLPIYQQSAPLVRGQKVVAIGSPLGMFNSFSNGIISGLRTIEDVDMIQFTAPISPGSSGGALLNMYGKVIGISTGGMNRGQNINLAVSYKNILPFVRGFL